jgi:hypothetical protein
VLRKGKTDKCRKLRREIEEVAKHKNYIRLTCQIARSATEINASAELSLRSKLSKY